MAYDLSNPTIEEFWEYVKDGTINSLYLTSKANIATGTHRYKDNNGQIIPISETTDDDALAFWVELFSNYINNDYMNLPENEIPFCFIVKEDNKVISIHGGYIIYEDNLWIGCQALTAPNAAGSKAYYFQHDYNLAFVNFMKAQGVNKMRLITETGSTMAFRASLRHSACESLYDYDNMTHREFTKRYTHTTEDAVPLPSEDQVFTETVEGTKLQDFDYTMVETLLDFK